MVKFNPYNENYFGGRCTSRDEYGNADVKGVDMSFMLGLPYEEMAILAQALNRLADFEDAEIAEDKKLREKSNKKMNDDLISRQAAIECLKTKIAEIFFKETAEKNVEKWLNELPTVQPEQRTGKWEKRTVPDSNPFFVTRYYCTACEDWNTYGESKFCPNCGAKMAKSKQSKDRN